MTYHRPSPCFSLFNIQTPAHFPLACHARELSFIIKNQKKFHSYGTYITLMSNSKMFNGFQEYSLEEELIGFRIELNILLECLTILDGDASMNLYYRGYGSPLRLVIVEDDIVTDCSIKTMEALETLHFTLPSEEVNMYLDHD